MACGKRTEPHPSRREAPGRGGGGGGDGDGDGDGGGDEGREPVALVASAATALPQPPTRAVRPAWM